MSYNVPELPYPYDALEPHIGKETMVLHHDKHHQAYVDKVNAALEGSVLDGAPIGEVVRSIDRLPANKQAGVRNNGGGHLNHSLFWEWLSPSGGGEPQGALAEALDQNFGSFDDFRAALKAAAIGQFGSGWAWLVRGADGLAIVSTANQDNPLSTGAEPLLGIDVWEHAYYLDYRNRRPDYIDAWWNVIDWDSVAKTYDSDRGEVELGRI